jgi:hypothetical protein
MLSVHAAAVGQGRCWAGYATRCAASVGLGAAARKAADHSAVLAGSTVMQAVARGGTWKGVVAPCGNAAASCWGECDSDCRYSLDRESVGCSVGVVGLRSEGVPGVEGPLGTCCCCWSRSASSVQYFVTAAS